MLGSVYSHVSFRLFAIRIAPVTCQKRSRNSSREIFLLGRVRKGAASAGAVIGRKPFDERIKLGGVVGDIFVALGRVPI